ncbi:maestro heat-like repeat-containing protein family member 1 [Clytia hemisphaerica]|uniref:Maestro heat-like repeat-containing protein family member 1 n=2 Tax=Clytia hemisphaerica TaxID=252671 RepID=A0A7M5X6V3_9CNID
MEKGIKKTGGNIDELVNALIDAAYDKKADVRTDMKCSLHNLGIKQPELVLTSCNVYLSKHQKLAQGHRVLLLEIMTKVIKDAGKDVSLEVAKELILLGSNEITKSKEIVPDWQTAASNVLVALGMYFSQEVMQEMLQKITPGQLPHYFVVLTLANLAKENVFGVVPFLKDIFSRMLSMLGSVKQDNLRWVFSSCMGSFSEAILEYCANIENAPYPDITKDRFSGEIFTAYEIMFGAWLNSSKEARVRLALVEAFGHMSKLLPRDKLEENLSRLLQGITNLYRRHPEHFVITQSLGMVLAAACEDGSLMLLPHLDQMLQGLHVQVCVEPDYNNIQSVKNFNELLRCFQVLTQAYSDRVVGFLQQKLEISNEKSRTSTISVFKHLVNSSDDYLQDKKELILSSVSIVQAESNLKVCRSFAQCIIAMAHHDYLGLEGGLKLVEFIIRMCSLSDDEKPPIKGREGGEVVLPSAVRSMCINILNLMSTTIDVMEDVLWPFLLQFLLPVHFTPALMPVCKALANIAVRKWEDDDPKYNISYMENVNLPRPQAVFARLIVIVGHPLKGGGRGIHVLNFLKTFAHNISPTICEMWETVIPKLTAYLEENAMDDESWNQKSWEDLILKLLAKTLSEVNDEEWFLLIGREIGQQLPLYFNCPAEKNFLYKCLGVILRKIGTTDFIREHLNLIFSTVDHNNQVEREGCAVGIGFCAASHLDQCLMKLEEVTKTQMIRKATGFMGLMKDKTEADVERIKCTVMLCYGYVVFYGPPGLICSRLEANVLRVINPHLTSAKDSSVKQNLIRSVELIGKAVQPKHVQREDFVFTRRGELLKHMKNYLSSEPKTAFTETRSLSIDACTNLVKLEPRLATDEIHEILTISMNAVYSVTNTVPVTVGKPKTEEEIDKMGETALESLNTLLKEVCTRELTPKYLQMMIKLVEPFMSSTANHERERSVLSIKDLLEHYLKMANFNNEMHFSTLGYILGRLLPRCTDPMTDVRQTTMECVQLLLTINDRYEGVPSNVSDERIQGLTQLRDALSKSDPAALFNVVNELSLVVSKKTPDEQLKTLVFSLTDGLNDAHAQSSSGACAILNCLMKFRGGELSKEVTSIVKEIVNNLNTVSFPATITGSLVAMRTLATHHLIPVLRAFLDYPVPFSYTVCEFWKTLAKDKDLTPDTFDHLLELFSRSPPYTEVQQDGGREPLKIAAPLSMAVCAAMTEMFKVPELEKLVTAIFPKLLSATMLRMGSCIGISLKKEAKKDGKPPSVPTLSPLVASIICFKELIARCDCETLRNKLEEEDVWAKFEDEETFPEGLQQTIVTICECQPLVINDLVTSLLPSLSSMYSTQRVVPAVTFSELINQRCCGDLQLVELLINSLLSKLVDPSHLVRQFCIRGLGNVASVGGQKLQTYSTTILSAMMAGMDDKEDPGMTITLEAMSGLSKILALLEESAVRQILINICLRIRPCFEKETAAVRAAAIELFGNLSRFGHGASESSFLEQIHTNFVSILLHLNEDNEVSKSCKTALRLLGPRIGSTSINDMFQKHLLDGGHLHYGEFMNDLSRLIITDYEDKVNFYVMGCVTFFKSNWEDIRSNAALFVGFLLGNLKSSQREIVSTAHVCNALVVLLKDPSGKVRSKAAEAMSLLYDY